MRNLLLIPFKKGESYKYLYFQRNMNFTFLRFLYFTLIILIGNCLIGLLLKKIKIFDFFSLLITTMCFFILKYIGIITLGYILKKNKEFKKLAIINIDIKTFLFIYLLPFLFIISYTYIANESTIYIISLIFLIFFLFSKNIFLFKSNNLIGLKFIDIILYICLLEIIPIIALYIVLK